ncbi:uncharacterized protein LOC125709938 isoform X2 [Brienomyrus brachyistius]|uniref:uncharacterized protein LOC125709938 isoform X2 n=1 Tax=Brienomyrus brachyistius TaxID=42636 RepID=UPI0020B21BD9|nr:uncharacterized protein LOC125709938 isoform X2 [Brienomyrus brachyistius]
MANPASYTFSSPRRSSGLHSKHTHQSAITPPTALEYVRNGRKVLMDVLKFPITVAKQLNKHGILSEEELCDIRRQSGGADATSKLLDMVIAKGEQACCELLQILHNKRQNMLDIGLSESVKATLQSLEEDLYHWINHFSGLARKSSSILSGNDLHLNVKEHEDEAVFEEARRIMQQSPEKMQLYLHVDQDFQHLGEAVKNLIFKCLPQISRIRLPSPSENFVLQLFFQAAINDVKTGEKTVTWLSKVIDFNSNDFDVESYNYSDELSWKKTDFLLDLHSHIKDYETETGLSVQSILQPVYQSAPEVWVVDLSKRKASILLEVMEFQTNKKPVKIISCSDTEKEQWHFLQCLPYISHLGWSKSHFNLKEAIKFMVNLFNQAAECDRKTGEKKLQLLSSVCSYSSFPFFGDKNCEDLKKQSDFLLDLYTYLKDSDHPSYKHVLLELQSAPAVWVIDLSERKASILLEVLELQTVKKPVKLVGWSDEKNDQWSLLKCLPYVSKLGLPVKYFNSNEAIEFMVNLFNQAAECDIKTGEKKLQFLSSVCSYSSFPFVGHRSSNDYSKKQSDFLLDLYSFLKDSKKPSYKHVLLALQPVYESAPAFWVIDLSKRKASILLEVLELQTVKKPVKLVGWSNEKTEIRSFLQCLPYVSQLRWSKCHFNSKEAIKFMISQAAECDRETGEKKLQLLSSVCSYSSFPFAGDTNTDDDLKKQSEFLLDLYSFLKDSDHPSYKQVVLALQPVYQSAPAVWVIDLSERKASILLEVLEFQTVKKPVKLVGWSDEENEQSNFLQCLPNVSELGFSQDNLSPFQRLPVRYFNSNEAIKFMVSLFSQAAECDIKTGEKKLQLLSSVCSYSSFPFVGDRNSNDYSKKQSDFLLDLYSFLKDSKNPSYKHVLLALQPVYQSAPAVWVIDLSKRKASILLEVLELQTVKKPVKLVGWSNVETEIRSFLQCLPYVSQLGLPEWHFSSQEAIKFLISLFIQAAECDTKTGEKKLQLLSSVCSYSSFPFVGDTNSDDESKKQSDFLLDLYSFLKYSNNPSYKHVLLALQPVYQSAPAVWVIDLSKRKASILLEVLEFQIVKKPVKLVGWSHAETELRSFLKCLPFVSQLGLHFPPETTSGPITVPLIRGLPVRHFNSKEAIKFIVSLFIQAAECDIKTGEKKLQLLSSVCSYSSFPLAADRNSDNESQKQSDFLLDLYSYLKDSEDKANEHVLQALLPVYQSAPAVWFIDLTRKKASIIFEVLEFQTMKKPVKLVGWSDEENEIKSFLQCLPYISQLGLYERHFNSEETIEFMVNLFNQAAECDIKTGEKKLQLLSSVCSYSSFPFAGDTNSNDDSKKQTDFMLDLYSFLKDSKNPSYKQVLLALQPVYQSAPAVWVIDLSERKASILPEVLEFQRVKKPVKLVGWLDEETEIRSFLQCLPYISQLGPCNNKITDMKTFLRDPDHDLWDQSKNQNTVEFKPDLNDHNGELSYSFSCESGGHFQCSATGLVFQMKAAGKVEYSPTYWDEAALKTAGYQPAGPLFNIENPDKGLCSLQLPHCEADVEERVHLSVAHFYSGNMEVLKPFAVTDTHVTMQIGNLSAFGIIKSVLSLITSQVRGQVLLFQPPRSTPQEQIYVFLLPSNVPLDQVTKQHTECRYIKTSSDCTFIRNQKYKVTSDLEGHHEIQPESQDFFCNYGPNFHPTFEVFFNDGITALKLAVMKNGEKVWGRRVRLPAEVAPDANQLAEKKPISLSPWKDFLLDVFDDLTDEELKNLKTRMPPPAGCKGIPKSKLQGADRTDLWNLMAESWGMEGSIMAIKGGLSKIQRNDLIEELNDFPKKLKKSSA